VLYIILKKRFKVDYFDPVLLFLTSSIIIFFTTAIRLVVYPKVFSIWTFIIYFSCFNLYILGSIHGLNKKRSIKVKCSSQKVFISLLSTLSCIYSLIVIKEVILGGNISSGLSLSELRGDFIDEVEQVGTIDIFSVIKGLSKSFATA
jgi:hypothetical protein